MTWLESDGSYASHRKAEWQAEAKRGGNARLFAQIAAEVERRLAEAWAEMPWPSLTHDGFATYSTLDELTTEKGS